MRQDYNRTGRKAKIIFVLTFPPPFHGPSISNDALWNSRVQQEFQCVLLDISDRRDLKNLGKMDFMNVKLALENIWGLMRLLKKKKPDLVYILVSQNELAYLRDGLFIIITRVLCNAKVIVHLRGSGFKLFYSRTNLLMKWFIDLTMGRVDAAIVLGRSLRYIFADWVKNVFVVPNGSDVIPCLDVGEKIRKNMQTGRFNVLFLSNLVRFKGILDVVKSAIRVVNEYPQVVYKIAGMWSKDPSGMSAEETKREAMRIVAANGLQRNVVFLGVVKGKDKERLLLESDVFVLPSVNEGLPVSIIEAMSAGCPVVSMPVGAVADTVIDGETGFLINSQDADLLADRIITLILDQDLRTRMSANARRRYEQLYTKNSFVENMVDTFQSILDQSGR